MPVSVFQRVLAGGVGIVLIALSPFTAPEVKADLPTLEAVAGPLSDDAVADAATQAGSAEDRANPARPGSGSTVRTVEMIEELITSARRRNERVQSTPVAVTSLGIQELKLRDVRRLSDIDALVPNVAIDNSFGASQAGRLTIRGVGQIETTTSFDPAVGVYIDGVYISRAQGQIGSLFDIERIEVLRGPQGTLYGKNTIGGAINVTTRKPEFEFGGDALVRVGNYDQFDTRLSVNVPINADVAAMRFSLATNYDEGYEKNEFLDERMRTDRLLGARSELLLLPSSDIEMMVTAEYIREDRRPQAARCIVTTGVARPEVAAVQGPNLTADGFATCRSAQSLGEKRFRSDIPADDDFRTLHFSNTINWEINSSAMLRSITSYRNQHYDVQQDLDGTELGIAQSEPDQGVIDSDAISQEFQLSGFAADDKLFYVLGLFAFREKIDDDTPGGGSLLSPEVQRRFMTGTGGLPLGPPFPLPILEEMRELENESFAAYASLTYDVTDKLSASLGLRRTIERRRLKKRDVSRTLGVNVVTFQPILPGDVVFDFEGSARFSDFSPSASLSYRVTPQILTYASYSTGFRSGAFNGRANFLNPDIEAIDPEELTTYELGVKSSFFDSRLVVNAVGFYSIYEDIQRPIFGPGPNGLLAIFFQNAAEARVGGLELEVAAVPMPGMLLEASIGTFKGRYTDFDDPMAPNLAPNPTPVLPTFGPGRDADDASLPGQPNYLMTFAVGYEQPLGSLGLLASRVQWTHRGQQANDARDTSFIRSSKYGLLDARVSLLVDDGLTEVTVFGSNLLDRVYINNGIDATDTAGRGVVFQGPPRRYGLEISRKF